MEKIIVYCDGGSRGNPGKSASAFVVKINGEVVKSGSVFLGIATNNVAEYSAVILALDWLIKNSDIRPALTWRGRRQTSDIIFILDSQLVARQLTGVYKVKNKKLKELFIKIKNLEKQLDAKIYFTSVSREKNVLADSLVNQELDKN